MIALYLFAYLLACWGACRLAFRKEIEWLALFMQQEREAHPPIVLCGDFKPRTKLVGVQTWERTEDGWKPWGDGVCGSVARRMYYELDTDHGPEVRSKLVQRTDNGFADQVVNGERKINGEWTESLGRLEVEAQQAQSHTIGPMWIREF